MEWKDRSWLDLVVAMASVAIPMKRRYCVELRDWKPSLLATVSQEFLDSSHVVHAYAAILESQYSRDECVLYFQI